MKKCQDYCKTLNLINDRCCIQPCIYQSLNILNNQSLSINAEGLATTFMLSVGNDSDWKGVVTESCDDCVQQASPILNVTDCNVIPLQFYSVVNCAYNEIYKQCPSWNPSSVQECEYTKEYVQSCV